MISTTFLVIGGGIAGVTCIEYLGLLAPKEKVILVSASPLVKSVTDINPLGKTLFSFNVVESNVSTLKTKHPYLDILFDKLLKIQSLDKTILTETGLTVHYKYLCICTGGEPNIICPNNERVIGIRDTDSVRKYMGIISKSKRIVIVGNGGIASEIVFATKCVETTWVIKDKHISSTFVDPGASEFFQRNREFQPDSFPNKDMAVKRIVYTEEKPECSNVSFGNCRAAALGPDWLKDKCILGSNSDSKLNILYETQVMNIYNNVEGDIWPLKVELSNGKTIECDLVVSATGVMPSSKFECDQEIQLGCDQGIAVDWRMETSLKDIFAAGDVCFSNWSPAPHWFQMRLWTQAYQMGAMAAKSMNAYLINDDILQDFCFELFSHTTKLFGYQVVLLGKFNGQGLDKKYEILIRTTPNLEYIKFVLVDNKLQGALLIGDTGLEETCENLILNQLDLSSYGDDLLNPTVDIEDYFD